MASHCHRLTAHGLRFVERMGERCERSEPVWFAAKTEIASGGPDAISVCRGML